ncbi:hypothetical protein BYT27DRAFT_7010188, partial [Phlegmacium glaucopus]
SRVQVSVKGTDGCVFLMYTDPSSLIPMTEDTSAREFAGIASTTPNNFLSEALKYHSFMAAIQEEYIPANIQIDEPKGGYRATVDWNTCSTKNFLPDYAFTQSIHDSPFFLDSGASSGISPIKEDFLNLRPFTRKVKGIGGSIIEAKGIGNIKI